MTPNRTPRKRGRRSSVSSKSSRASRSRSKGRSVSKSRSFKATGQDSAAVSHSRIKKGIKRKNPFTVKVTRKFAKKVKKVLQTKDVKGTGCLQYPFGLFQAANNQLAEQRTLPHQQMIFSLDINSSQLNPLLSVHNGDALHIHEHLYLLSRMFGGKAKALTFTGNTTGFATQGVPVVGSEGAYTNTRMLNNLVYMPSISTNKVSFPLKYDVLNAECNIQMRNNSQRAIYLEMYECQPKYQRTVNFQIPTTSCLPINDWIDALGAEALGTVSGTKTEGTVTGPGVNESDKEKAASNISDMRIVASGAKPERMKAWNKLWKFTKTLVKLEPGQSHIHSIKGDKGTVDWQKMCRDSKFMEIQKWNRYVFFIAKNDMTWGQGTSVLTPGGEATTISGVANWDDPSTTINQGLGIYFKVEKKYKFSMPEQTGGFITDLNDGTGTKTRQLLNNQRRECYVHDVISDDLAYVQGTLVGNSTRNVDDNNPVEID